MALIKCSECGKEISSTALSCPYCGAPNKAAQIKEEQRKANQTTTTALSLIGCCITVFGKELGLSDLTTYGVGLMLLVTAVVFMVAAKKEKSKEE